jgi:hypothetical protein
MSGTSVPYLTQFAPGQGVIPAAWCNTVMQAGCYLANLRAFSGLPNQSVYMIGYSAQADGGQGTFCWSANAGTDDGGVTTIVPYGVTQGCWIRLVENANIIAPSSLSIIGNPSIAYSPLGNPDSGGNYNTHSTLVVEGTTTLGNTGREFLVQMGLTATDGAPDTANLGDKVALYPSIVGSGSPGNIWAINPLVTLSSGSGSYCAQGLEVDINNYSYNAATVGDTFVGGITITGTTSGANICTYGLSVEGASTTGQWQYGVLITSANQSAIWDSSGSTSVVLATGTHAYGLDFQGATFTTAGISLASGDANGLVFLPTSGATPVYTYCDANGNLLLGQNSDNVVSCSSLIPLTNNTVFLGDPSMAWEAVYSYAFNTISDPSLKTNIGPVGASMLDVVNELKPVTFEWRQPATRMVPGTERKLVHDYEIVTRTVDDHEIRDGRAYKVTRTVEAKAHLYDDIPVHHDNGDPVIGHLPAKLKHLRQGMPQEQATHRVPRMVERDVPAMVPQPVEDAPRTQWGFLAPEVKEVIARRTGMDFAGVSVSPDGLHTLDPMQLLPILTRALQEADAKIEALTARVSQLEPH